MAPGEPKVKRESLPLLDLLVIDNPVWELTILVDVLPSPEEVTPQRREEWKARAIRWVEAGGGSAANTAVFVAALGRQVGLIGQTGDDEFGMKARQELITSGLYCVLPQLSERTTKQSVIVKQVGTDRGFFRAWVPERVATPIRTNDIDDNLWSQARLIHLDRVSEVGFDKVMGGAGPAVSLDLHTCPGRTVVLERLEQLIPRLSVMQISEAAALRLGELYGLAGGLVEVATHLGRRIPWLVVTRGAQGALASEHGRMWEVEAWPTPVVDSTGAGDTFCACILDSWLAGQSLEEACPRAALAGALQCQYLGARGFKPSQQVLESLLGSGRFRYNEAAMWSGGADAGTGSGGDDPGIGECPYRGEAEG